MTDTGANSTAALRARARESLLGLACGDALGRPVGGDSPAAVRDRHGRVTEMLGAAGGPAGTTTRPTTAAVTAAERLLGRRDATGHTSPDDPHSTDRPGSLLAAVPAAFARERPDDRAATAAAATDPTAGGTPAATSGDPSGDETAAALAVIVGELVDGAAIECAVSTAMDIAVARDGPVALRESLSVVGDRGAARIDPAGDRSAVFETALQEAVAAGDAEEAIVSAVSRGGNASALGAIAGAVAGARFGEQAIPPRWLNELEAPADLRALADALVETETEAETETVTG